MGWKKSFGNWVYKFLQIDGEFRLIQFFKKYSSSFLGFLMVIIIIILSHSTVATIQRRAIRFYVPYSYLNIITFPLVVLQRWTNLYLKKTTNLWQLFILHFNFRKFADFYFEQNFKLSDQEKLNFKRIHDWILCLSTSFSLVILDFCFCLWCR